MDSNRNSLKPSGQQCLCKWKIEIQNSLECGSQMELLTTDFFPFEVLTKHDLSLDIIVKNRFMLEGH